MAKKIAELRILAGEKSALDLGAPILVVSQFTLYGETAKGRRPSWAQAAPSELAKPVIDKIVAELRERGLDVATGSFGAMMEVSSVNQGQYSPRRVSRRQQNDLPIYRNTLDTFRKLPPITTPAMVLGTTSLGEPLLAM